MCWCRRVGNCVDVLMCWGVDALMCWPVDVHCWRHAAICCVLVWCTCTSVLTCWRQLVLIGCGLMFRWFVDDIVWNNLCRCVNCWGVARWSVSVLCWCVDVDDIVGGWCAADCVDMDKYEIFRKNVKSKKPTTTCTGGGGSANDNWIRIIILMANRPSIDRQKFIHST
jgi:hypothetical protein